MWQINICLVLVEVPKALHFKIMDKDGESYNRTNAEIIRI